MAKNFYRYFIDEAKIYRFASPTNWKSTEHGKFPTKG